MSECCPSLRGVPSTQPPSCVLGVRGHTSSQARPKPVPVPFHGSVLTCLAGTFSMSVYRLFADRRSRACFRMSVLFCRESYLPHLPHGSSLVNREQAESASTQVTFSPVHNEWTADPSNRQYISLMCFRTQHNPGQLGFVVLLLVPVLCATWTGGTCCVVSTLHALCVSFHAPHMFPLVCRFLKQSGMLWMSFARPSG